MNTLKCIWMFSLGLILAASMANAQEGTIQGTVTDPSGSAIARANVTALNLATGTETTRTTNESGLYVLTVDPGDYKIQVTATGFETLVRPKITMDALATIGLDLQLTVGSASTQITVEET